MWLTVSGRLFLVSVFSFGFCQRDRDKGHHSRTLDVQPFLLSAEGNEREKGRRPLAVEPPLLLFVSSVFFLEEETGDKEKEKVDAVSYARA